MQSAVEEEVSKIIEKSRVGLTAQRESSNLDMPRQMDSKFLERKQA